MSELVPFDFNDHQVRIVMREGDPWWIVKDLESPLNLTNIRKSIENFPQEEIAAVTTSYGSQRREITIISEAGLYRLIFQSRKPEAEAFKSWVFNEVLPSIRKTGKYEIQRNLSSIEQAREMVELSQKWLKAEEKALEAGEEAEAAKHEVEVIKPKAEAHEIQGGELVAQIRRVMKNRIGHLLPEGYTNNDLWHDLRKMGAVDHRTVTDEWYWAEWAYNENNTPIFSTGGINEIERNLTDKYED